MIVPKSALNPVPALPFPMQMIVILSYRKYVFSVIKAKPANYNKKGDEFRGGEWPRPRDNKIEKSTCVAPTNPQVAVRAAAGSLK